jgi:hypothetical protein
VGTTMGICVDVDVDGAFIGGGIVYVISPPKFRG